MLEREQHEVAEALDGMQALKLCRQQPFDLVITDILMPNKEGLETIIEMRREHPGIKIIAMSGGGRTGNLEFLDAAEMMGAHKTLGKPFSRQEMSEAIRELLAGGQDDQAGGL
jgi:CheY-like chemotaxis protein